MAFTNYYLIAAGTGSADINAGSSIGAAQVTTTNGNWSTVTGIFVAGSGTPFGSTVVGDYASIYVDGATVAVFVAKVLTVTSNVSITVDITTLKYGTAPTTSATGRSCTINGSWNTEQVLAAGGLATTIVPQSTKINIKGNLTITASRTISMAGATTTPLWFSFYNTTPGDLDADTTNALTKPIWTVNATFLLTTSGNHQLWSGVSVVGNRTGQVWSATATVSLVRVRCENTSSNVAAVAFSHTGSGILAYSWFKTPTTATTTGTLNIASMQGAVVGCVSEGGGIAAYNIGAAALTLVGCVALSPVGAGVLCTTAAVRIVGLTVYGATVDGIKWTGTPSANLSIVTGCLFSGLNGSTATTNGINNASGTNTNNVFRSCNDYYNVTNPEVGMGDSFAFFPQTDSNPVVTSATNMTPVTGANALAHGFPGIFENETFSSYQNIGSVQQLSAGGGFSGNIFGG